MAPRAEARTLSDHAAGAYSVNAAPGLGYQYRWDVNGDGQWDSEDFGETAEVKFNLEVDAERKVRLEVKNAFGRVAEAEFLVLRPKPDQSSAPDQTVLEIDPEGNLRPRGDRPAPGDTPDAPGHEGHGHPPGEQH